MARVGKEYLLGKLANRSKFCIEDSKKETIKMLETEGKDYYNVRTEEEWQDIKTEINDINSFCSEEMFYVTVCNIVPNVDFESVALIKDYPYSAYFAIDLFIKYVQPILKEEWNNMKGESKHE